MSKYIKLQKSLAIILWVWVSFLLSQSIVVGILWFIKIVNLPIILINETIFNFVIMALVYLLMMIIVIAIPWLIKKHKTNRNDLGITHLPLWSDIFITPAGFIIYLILASLLTLLAKYILPWFDVNQVQVTGFDHLSQQYQYILAFISLVVIAPIAEELLFRGYMYGKLKKYIPIWLSILITSALFGAIHGSWNIAIDTFSLSVILCLLRESTGSLWSSILLHMMKNGIAFYILFISPLLLIH